ncbi:MAG: hypothetical protein ACR2HH_00105 [Chthoniobacterales bacterium]
MGRTIGFALAGNADGSGDDLRDVSHRRRGGRGSYGLLPSHAAQMAQTAARITVTAPGDAELSPARWSYDSAGRSSTYRCDEASQPGFCRLSAVVFVGTSICGALPSLNWNIFMCFLMELGAGGMLPVTYALLAETMPSGIAGGPWCW